MFLTYLYTYLLTTVQGETRENHMFHAYASSRHEVYHFITYE